ncbi:uncharacterized protein METZ01_LOCUS275437, partial [marine metagenome]
MQNNQFEKILGLRFLFNPMKKFLFIITLFSLVFSSLWAQTPVRRYYDDGTPILDMPILGPNQKNLSASKNNGVINAGSESNSSGGDFTNKKEVVTLETTFANNNGSGGIYFQVDVLNASGITVTSLEGNFGNTGTAQVFVRDGVVGSDAGTGWTEVASATISGTGRQSYNVNFSLAAGSHTFFFTGPPGSENYRYTNGTALGNVAAENSDLKIYEGHGSFNTTPGATPGANSYHYTPRIWNGSITYDESSPTISSAALAADNSYIDLTMSSAVYNTTGGSGALEAADFTLTFAQNSGSATAASISSVKQNDNTAEASATALAGGETVIRFFLSITGTPSGVETITITPANGSSIYNAAGAAMASSQTTGAKTLNDKVGPSISSVSLQSDNAKIAVTFPEA